MPHKQDPEFLRAALMGLQDKLSEIERQMTELRSRIGVQPVSASRAEPGAGKRNMSAAARRRIGLAQKKRWAAYKAGDKEKPARKKAVQEKPSKRVMSAEGRARIVAATKKRWAAFRKAQKETTAPAASPDAAKEE